MAKKPKAPAKSTAPVAKAVKKPAGKSTATIAEQVDAVLAWLEKTGTKATRDGMARYAIPSDTAFGVPVGVLRKYAKSLGANHELALALWETGRYEARLLAAFVDDPAQVTTAQMDRWRRDFSDWAVCDTVCFHLFDRTPHAFRKIAQWSSGKEEFARRGAFALLACVALHDQERGEAANDQSYIESLPLIEAAATDERNFVKKAVNWALRAVGRRNATLHAASVDLAKRLAASSDATSRWIGKDALRELTSPAVVKKLSAKASAKKSSSKRPK